MKEIEDQKRIHYYLEKGGFSRLFSTLDLPFKLRQYEKGEVLTSTTVLSGHLLFMVKGSYNVYLIRNDGSEYYVHQSKKFGFIGDSELLGFDPPTVKAVTSVECLALPIRKVRDRLLSDVLFLRALSNNLAWKLSVMHKLEGILPSSRDRLLEFFNNPIHNGRIDRVEDVLFEVRCSRRHLQRVLKELCEEGLIQKTGRGHYEKCQCKT